MRKMFRTKTVWMLGAAVVAVMMTANVEQAEARPPFLKLFVTQYPKLADAAKAAKCGVCHPKKDKKVRNAYGMALGKAIGKKNEKDKSKVTEAIKKTEAGKSAVKGKTFGDLIKAGKLPASAE